ncbi:MAG: hypothetical protein HZB16_05390 [Armatimonadetes bacterium]|nr:hypothetical protein [Armatimonadota bacterium]
MPPARRASADLAGIALITAGLLLAVGLRTTQAGPLVTWLTGTLGLLLGQLVDAMPVAFIFLGVRAIWQRDQLHPNRAAAPALALLGLVACGFFHQRVPSGEEFASTASQLGWLHPPAVYGGVAGAVLVWVLRHLFGELGCPIVLGMGGLAGLLLLSERTVRELMSDFGRSAQRRGSAAKAAAQRAAQNAAARRAAMAPAPPRRGNQLQIADLSFPEADESFLPPVDRPKRRGKQAQAPVPPPESILPPPELLAPDEPEVPEVLAEPPATPVVATGPGELPPHQSKLAWAPFDAIKADPVPPMEDSSWIQMVLPGMPEPKRRRGSASSNEEFPVPAASLIQPPPSPPLPDRSPEIQANSRRLEGTMASFGVEARVVNTEIGPTITRYEMGLGSGVRVSKVAGMADDIALALASAGIRIEAPVPGKGVIGIEVPNQIRETVDLHATLLSPEFGQAKGGLPFVIGKDIAGHIKIGDLARMPHMLVAGTTNSGKSVCLNCVIISLIYRFSPRDLRFLMVDPKRVELTLYDGIPHLDRPVVTDPDDAADLLRGAVREMYARYDRLSELGVRNIISYNEQVTEEEHMPYLVIIIDELAELMMTARAEVEASIVRLAQLARAVGIHLVLATQRPAVNVVTGQIKANIPTRCAFRVPQLVDSRVILDDKGAERLIGRGDMLFASEETGGKPERLQGAFVGEQQVHKLVNWLRNLPSTLTIRYADSIIQPVAADDGAASDEDGGIDDTDLDELFWQCVQLVRSEGEASTSRLQRTFGIGYNRAGRIMDQMHALGVVGPPRGSKPRELMAGGPTSPSDRRRAANEAAEMEFGAD